MPNLDKDLPQLSEMHFRQISYNSALLPEARLSCCWNDQAAVDVWALGYQGPTGCATRFHSMN
jgi:hypothetical protein